MFHVKKKKMNDTSISVLAYPSDFLNSAKYIGLEHVAQKDCHHFYSPRVSSSGKFYGMDLWFTSDVEKLPCLISITDTTTTPPTVMTWAFDGMRSTIPPDAMGKCQYPKSICVEENYICKVRNNSDKVAIQKALSWVCNPENLDCSPIQPNGDHYYPNDLVSHANWAFNAYYQKNKDRQGSAACDFGGLAELVPPSNKARVIKSNLPPSAVFLFDLICPAML